MLPSCENKWSHQVPILHMPQQMCKFVADLNLEWHLLPKRVFMRFELWALKPFVKWIPFPSCVVLSMALCAVWFCMWPLECLCLVRFCVWPLERLCYFFWVLEKTWILGKLGQLTLAALSDVLGADVFFRLSGHGFIKTNKIGLMFFLYFNFDCCFLEALHPF